MIIIIIIVIIIIIIVVIIISQTHLSVDGFNSTLHFRIAYCMIFLLDGCSQHSEIIATSQDKRSITITSMQRHAKQSRGLLVY